MSETVTIEREAMNVRKRTIEALNSETTTLREVADYSKADTSLKEALYVSRLKLYDILRKRRGWTNAEAERALTSNGFTTTDTIRSIRNRIKRFQAFLEILETPVEAVKIELEDRPRLPDGWPWRGKLESLIEMANSASKAEPAEVVMEIDWGDPDQKSLEPAQTEEVIESLVDDLFD